ncbi:PROBABLE NADPH:ADRENODOXIN OXIDOREDUCTASE FPRA (NADPH-FERREDOXIN REDUCTASE) [Streptomyces scabiei 87.22]|uniref:ferredoxin--NADP(+) reductase n=1 Tax=Streptomyces scabiei (strain 87.22) TaxID=680198 RepID=C9YU71_STRSW|nr:FAD-dependent oxidoreductase [Streptomyces scabiei]MDX2576385.1 FAD-dependent oxidoreductase [Streptomyces scabiei]MDX2655721.1 FAD-dependent oxidoreductase [Streptomyces scabiei]MDX2721445.1 FAD-dependent oxidoreductase [Streptomyces scabiei]MDX2867572.1 FAD-dependent oxidoreductase [Streptomyces scabiei]MDX2887369.1 FAD-dependent oxidoreductase [Streptomyces scabiei]
MLRVAVVGSGPSGCYTAQSLVQQDSGVLVDVLDRLPCPYGLVRYGVAPDHEKIKSLQNNLRAVLEHERVRFLGGVRVGPDGVPAARLRELYHAVVYCVGAAADRRLGIPGEELRGSWSATEFVSWYSAHPDATDRAFGGPVLGARTAVVVGVGNVAVDVTRMLARGARELSPTDMPQAALASLAASEITQVHMVGRRGPSQARFTTKELRELSALPDTRVGVNPAELELDPDYVDPSSLPAARRRNVEVLRGWATAPPPSGRRRIRLRFFLRPVELLADGDRVCGVRLERTAPDGHGGVTGTGRFEEIEAQLVLRSVGYRGVPLDGLPFDPVHGTVPHAAGRVLRDGAPSPGEYVAGWIKRGPTGVIGTNRPCAKETAASLLEDAPELAVRHVPDDPVAALRAGGCEPVEWRGWQAIERAEAALGASLGRGVVKLPDWDALMTAARTGPR